MIPAGVKHPPRRSGSKMLLDVAKEEARIGQRQSRGAWFRLVYYAVVMFVAGILAGALYLGSHLQ